MAKVITIDNTRFVLPEGMTNKEIQSLAGLLITLVKVDSCYLYPNYDNLFYAGEGVQVGVANVELMTKEEARAKSDQSREAYEAKKAAQAVS